MSKDNKVYLNEIEDYDSGKMSNKKAHARVKDPKVENIIDEQQEKYQQETKSEYVDTNDYHEEVRKLVGQGWTLAYEGEEFIKLEKKEFSWFWCIVWFFLTAGIGWILYVFYYAFGKKPQTKVISKKPKMEKRKTSN